jgi:hypothetical protein
MPHSTEKWELNGLMMYGKNVSMAFGRCPVRSIFEEALAVLVQEQKKVAFLCGKTMSLEDAPQAYRVCCDLVAKNTGVPGMRTPLTFLFPSRRTLNSEKSTRLCSRWDRSSRGKFSLLCELAN